MDETISVGCLIETKNLAAQLNCPVEPLFEKRRIDRFVRMGGQQAKGDARVAIVKPAPHELAAAIENIDDASRRNSLGRLFDHLLEDPRMVRTTFDFQADLQWFW